MKTARLRWGIAVVIILAYFPLFLHLDGPPIKLWDESLYAMRAYYMAEHWNYLQDFSWFPWSPSHPNLKPPFGTIIQALSFQLLGYGELALRLPVALFGVATILLLSYSVSRYTRHAWAGVASGLILMSCAGFVRMHGTRTGDHDVILAFWMLLTLFTYYKACETLKTKWIWATMAGLLFAFLTKSVAAFFFLPGFLVFALVHRKLIPLLKNPGFYGGAALFISCLIGYYAFMEGQLPGFWSAVKSHVFGRMVTVINQHQQPWYYYLTQFWEQGFFPWLWLLPLALFDLRREDKLQHLLWFSLLSQLAVISVSSTKLSWYSLPVYPLLAAILGMAFWRQLQHPNRFVRVLVGAIGISVWLFAYQEIVSWAMNYRITASGEKTALLLKKAARELPDLKSISIYTELFDGQSAFYSQWYNDKKGYDIQVQSHWSDDAVKPGDHLLVCHSQKLKRVQKEYETTPILYYEECQLLRLEQPKKDL